MAIDKFEVGKWYKWTGPKEDLGSSKANMFTDGVPRKCIGHSGENKDRAILEGIQGGWWSYNTKAISEVQPPAPNIIGGWKYLAWWDAEEAKKYIGTEVRYGDSKSDVMNDVTAPLKGVDDSRPFTFTVNGVNWEYIGIPLNPSAVLELTIEEIAAKFDLKPEQIRIKQ
jgi:hypothetical protein